MAFPFLTARWLNLCLLTYAVPPDLLQPRVPPGLTLDRRANRTFVSLVAFQFLNTRVRGIAWPGYRHFAELNLRFYVRHGEQRGVVFIREFVPQRLVAWLARTLYHEPYRTAPISHQITSAPDRVLAEYRLHWAGRTHRLAVEGRPPAIEPAATTVEHFFKEHHWGFGVDRRGRTLGYRVEHPIWKTYPVMRYEVDFDWEAVYGPEWRILADAAPSSVVLAEGSAVAVYPHGRLADNPAVTANG